MITPLAPVTVDVSKPAIDPMIAASEQAARLLKAMANPARLRILCLVAEGERPVGEIAQVLGLREPAASQQLAQLRMENLVVARKDAQRVIYRLASNEVERILATLRDIFCPPV
ncbi:winged helix-turn-helix transcriptional regulator [Phreatobacter aquaticus]|uniref:Winged helix-turn-helix transcriptional regulator n=1 Tax=Phreatobacter aquaticus TaxID=2570229 RepID=A0A4D7QIU3_9HYPH|nr:metalloregulator ArsR/SmtB family transcription factor [Phreatobacter aquaticus]QCK85237.1 winged helix-turn-helix transcriptional regulator [Phreatobacter aquaticus]